MEADDWATESHTLTSTQRRRERINASVQEFLNSGGQIHHIPSGLPTDASRQQPQTNAHNQKIALKDKPLTRREKQIIRLAIQFETDGIFTRTDLYKNLDSVGRGNLQKCITAVIKKGYFEKLPQKLHYRLLKRI